MKTQMTTVTTLRSTARTAVAAEAHEAATREHRQNYHRLHVRRDGTLHWFSSHNRSEDIIDDQAVRFAPVQSVIVVGMGDLVCNCRWCANVGPECADHRGDYYETQDEAIADAVCESGTGDIEDQMLAEFARIPAGYFDDEAFAGDPQ